MRIACAASSASLERRSLPLSDTSLLTAVVQHRTPWLDDVMVFFSTIGDRGAIWLALAAAGLLFTNRKPAAWRLALAMLCTALVVDVALKAAFLRPRPYEVLSGIELIIARPTTSSFPSTHAALAIAGALGASRLFPAAAWVLWPLGLLIGLSRIYVGAHWPSDVVAGGLIGAACAWFVLGGRLDRAPTALR